MFAHALIDEAEVDIIYGHSSHHPRPIEVYKEKLIIYGAGDLLNDFEGLRMRKISRLDLRKLMKLWKYWKPNGHKKFRSDLVLMYFASVEPFTGKLVNLRLIPMQIKKLRLNYPSPGDVEWLKNRMNKVYEKFNSRIEPVSGLTPGNLHNTLLLGW